MSRTQLCEVCRASAATQVIQSDQKSKPFQVCDADAKRLIGKALTPLGWLNAVSVHGRQDSVLDELHYSHRGDARAPELKVSVTAESRFPTVESAENDSARLLDIAIAWYPASTVGGPSPKERDLLARKLQVIDRAALHKEIAVRLLKQPPIHVAMCLAELGGAYLDARNAKWVSELWLKKSVPIGVLSILSSALLGKGEIERLVRARMRILNEAHRAGFVVGVSRLLLEKDENRAFAIIEGLLSRVPVEQRAYAACLSLSWLKDARALQWIAANAEALMPVGSKLRVVRCRGGGREQVVWDLAQLAVASGGSMRQYMDWIEQKGRLGPVALRAILIATGYRSAYCRDLVLPKTPQRLRLLSGREMSLVAARAASERSEVRRAVQQWLRTQ